MKKGFLLAGYTYLQKIYTINLALQKLEKIWATRKLFLTIRKLPNVTELHNQSTDEVGTPLWRPSHQAPCSEKSQSWLLGAVSIVLSPGMDPGQPLLVFVHSNSKNIFFWCLNGISLLFVLSRHHWEEPGSVFSTPFMHSWDHPGISLLPAPSDSP